MYKRQAIKVKNRLIATRIAADIGGRDALSVSIPVSECRIMFTIRSSPRVSNIHMTPAAKPTLSVSALKTLEISFFDAPTERRIPISFVLSRTEI